MSSPTAPAAAPSAADDRAEPKMKKATVTGHLDERPRSPSGVMLASIDSPHGDHADLIAATAAIPMPTTTAAAAVVIRVVPRPRAGGRPGRGSGGPARCPPR
ncbi:MAG: hypothetical protein E6G29_07240 [Actinobacteria bacterium]|nr:MAG: hypothetical protein E6G29_07240 [Actinomycetota bacterium]